MKSRGFADGIMCRSSSAARNARMANKRSGSNCFVAERTDAWLKCGFHRIGARYERKEENYLAFVTIASTIIYWRFMG